MNSAKAFFINFSEKVGLFLKYRDTVLARSHWAMPGALPVALPVVLRCAAPRRASTERPDVQVFSVFKVCSPFFYALTFRIISTFRAHCIPRTLGAANGWSRAFRGKSEVQIGT